MFNQLLSACTRWTFGESLASNPKKHIKCVSPNNRPCHTTIIHEVFEKNCSCHMK